MAKFYGKVGYVEVVETSYQVYKSVEYERSYYGDVTRVSRRLDAGSKINDDITLSNLISIVADAYAFDHIFALRYVWWMGNRWKVTNVEVQRPRLVLTLGGLYNGNEN